MLSAALTDPATAVVEPVCVKVSLTAVGAVALAGTTDNRPKPIADTATSAMRLRSVFVDICFLSISQNQEFPDLGFG